MGVGGQCHALTTLPLRKTQYLLYRRLGGPQGQFGWMWKILLPPGFDPQTIQPVASRYTDCTIPVYTNHMFLFSTILYYLLICCIKS
jgi:hypothetical protein